MVIVILNITVKFIAEQNLPNNVFKTDLQLTNGASVFNDKKAFAREVKQLLHFKNA